MFANGLKPIVVRLNHLIKYGKDRSVHKILNRLEAAATDIGKSWSRSSLGYHSNIYYKGLKRPPSDARFDSTFGLMYVPSNSRTRGDWIEFDPDEVRAAIYRHAEDPDMHMLRKFNRRAVNEFKRLQTGPALRYSYRAREKCQRFLENTQRHSK